MPRRKNLIPLLALLPATAAPGVGTGPFVNWESPHVSPIDATSTRVLAVNTPDNRLEVFEIDGTSLTSLGAVPVGLDPVSVRARTATEAWVVNHVSDSISVVDLVSMSVVTTILTGDEPTDVVFAQGKAFVSISQRNEVHVYDPADLSIAPTVIAIEGEDPRALATDGTRVFAAIFESGNDTTIIADELVDSNANPYPGNMSPPPNTLSLDYDPPLAPGLPDPPGSGVIVRRDEFGAWRDQPGTDWSAAVTWDLHGHDVAIIDAATLGVSYASRLMNLDMALAVSPGGDVVVVGTESLNEVRFESNLNGVFLRVVGATFAPDGTGASIVDLNPHLDYSSSTAAPAVRQQSIGDPRGVAFAAGKTFISGMGSNNVGVFDAALGRTGLVDVGEGPTGLVTSMKGDQVFAINKFEGAISIIDPFTETETARVTYFDPTPPEISNGRPFLYDTHLTSGLGHVSCASCHIDGRLDQLAWDLGQPDGEMKKVDQVCNFGFGGCEDWHPMKGPMTTQTLVGILDTGPLHWRGDRADFGQFNPAFTGILSADAELSGPDMDAFEAFIMTLTYPPNPYRNLDNSLPTTSPFGGNPVEGFDLYMNAPIDGGAVTCNQCHAFPTGTNGELTSAPLLQETQSMKIPQLRNMHEKTGFSMESMSNNRGFGFSHDGDVGTLFDFLLFPGFNFGNDDERHDVAAFMMAFSIDTHAAVGQQATVDGSGEQDARRDALLAIAEASSIGLVAHGVINGETRGWYLIGGGEMQSDRIAETTTVAALDASGASITWTAVPLGSQIRIGAERDGDGFLDGDERDACADAADPASTPDNSSCCNADVDGSGTVDFTDLVELLANWGPCSGCSSDVDGSGEVDFTDLIELLAAWGPC